MESNYPHFWLYAKLWYVKSTDDVIGDTKKLISNFSGCKPEHVSDSMCFKFWREVLSEAQRVDPTSSFEKALVQLWEDYDPFRQSILGKAADLPHIRIIKQIISIVQLAKVRESDVELMKLPKPDPEVAKLFLTA